MKNVAPIIAVLVLLLPVLYVASYLALVVPGDGTLATYPVNDPLRSRVRTHSFQTNYRRGHRISERIFWPLEQIDRKVRPEAWRFSWENELRDFSP